MTLFAYNITGSTVTLAAGNPSPVLPPSTLPPARGPGRDVTSELKGLSAADYALLEAQRPSVVEYEWTGDPEFSLGTLTSGAVSSHDPSLHASTHAMGGSDAVTVDDVTAVSQTAVSANQNTAATNQNTVAISQTATISILAADNTVATNQTNVASNQGEVLTHHETFLAPEGPGVSKGTIGESSSVASPTTQPTHPSNLIVDFAPGWAGGDVRVDGIGADGQAVTELFASSPGTGVVGVKAFALIDTPNGFSNTAPTAGVDTASIDIGDLLGLASSTPTTAFKIAVNGGANSFTTTSPANRTIEPGTGAAKNGTRNYEVWYTSEHTHVQDPHTHVQDAHTHAMTDGGHTHVQEPHTHVQDAHGHTQVAHTHVQDAHGHTTS